VTTADWLDSPCAQATFALLETAERHPGCIPPSLRVTAPALWYVRQHGHECLPKLIAVSRGSIVNKDDAVRCGAPLATALQRLGFETMASNVMQAVNKI
jgi:hypothetical protein